jgi:hypothetical protein
MNQVTAAIIAGAGAASVAGVAPGVRLSAASGRPGRGRRPGLSPSALSAPAPGGLAARAPGQGRAAAASCTRLHPAAVMLAASELGGRVKISMTSAWSQERG